MIESLTVHQEMVMMPEERPHSDEPKSVVCDKNRKLILAVFAFFLFAITLGLIVYSHQQKTEDPWMLLLKSAAPPCLSPACQRASEHFSVAMDPFSRPCDYFLSPCGAGESSSHRGRQRGKEIVVEENRGQDKKREAMDGELVRMRGEVTDDEGKHNGQQDKFPDRQTALLKAIKEILESPDEGVCISTAEQKAKKYFKTCTESESPEKVGSEPFLTLLQQLGGWAVLGEWKKTDFNSTLALLMGQYSTFPFFSVYVGPNAGDGQTLESSQPYIQIDEPHFQFPIDWNSKTQKSKASSQYLRPFFSSCSQYLALLGVPTRHVKTTQHCGLYMSLSTTLAVATSPLPYRLSQRLLYHRITIQELQNVASAIDWLACLQATFQPLPVSQSDVVLVHNLPYIIHMSQTISQWKIHHDIMGTDPLHTYMIFSLLQTLIPALDKRFTQTRRNFSIATGDTQEDVPRWWKCVQQTERGFDTLLSHVIRERHAQKEAEELIHDVYSSLKMKLADLTWRDKKSSALILNKIKSLTPRLSTERNVVNHSALNQLYAKVLVSEEDYFSNYLQMLMLEQKSRSRMLSHTTHAEGLSITPFLSGNDIIVPVGMFVSPFFHSSHPRALNYGTLGFLMAKDFLHLLLPDIHTQAKNPELESACMWSHYLSVTESPGRVGAFSLPLFKQQEVWVQYSALQVALHAYKMSFTRCSSDSSLSGLSYIHLFLSSFTKVSCDTDSYREFMPFEPSFLVSVLCLNSQFCPKPLTCLNKHQSYPPEMCLS